MLYHACGESIGVYRCPNKKVDAYAVYTNTVPAGAFRGYGLSADPIFAVESAMDELARALGMDPIEFRRRNVVRPGDAMVSADAPTATSSTAATASTSASTWCRPRMRQPRDSDRAAPPGWLAGEGVALAMIDTVPPSGHFVRRARRAA